MRNDVVASNVVTSHNPVIFRFSQADKLINNKNFIKPIKSFRRNNTEDIKT